MVLAQHDGLGKLMAKLCFYVNCGNGNAVWRASLVRGISLYTAVCLRTTQYWWEHRFREDIFAQRVKPELVHFIGRQASKKKEWTIEDKILHQTFRQVG